MKLDFYSGMNLCFLCLHLSAHALKGNDDIMFSEREIPFCAHTLTLAKKIHNTKLVKMQGSSKRFFFIRNRFKICKHIKNFQGSLVNPPLLIASLLCYGESIWPVFFVKGSVIRASQQLTIGRVNMAYKATFRVKF